MSVYAAFRQLIRQAQPQMGIQLFHVLYPESQQGMSVGDAAVKIQVQVAFAVPALERGYPDLDLGKGAPVCQQGVEPESPAVTDAEQIALYGDAGGAPGYGFDHQHPQHGNLQHEHAEGDEIRKLGQKILQQPGDDGDHCGGNARGVQIGHYAVVRGTELVSFRKCLGVKGADCLLDLLTGDHGHHDRQLPPGIAVAGAVQLYAGHPAHLHKQILPQVDVIDPVALDNIPAPGQQTGADPQLVFVLLIAKADVPQHIDQERQQPG